MSMFKRALPATQESDAAPGIPPIRNVSSRRSYFRLVLVLSLGTATALTLILMKLHASAAAAAQIDAGSESPSETAFPSAPASSPHIFVAPFLKTGAQSEPDPAWQGLPAAGSSSASAHTASILPGALSVPLDLSHSGGRIEPMPAAPDSVIQPPRIDILMVNSPATTPALPADTVRAQRHLNTSLMLAAGSVIGCALETAINSEKSGLVTCVVTDDVFGDDAKNILIEHGTHVLGDYRGEIKQGDARIGVIWNRLRKSDGTTIDLMSPGTDPQGRAGIAGNVDNHWVSRFGAAVLLSVIEDTIAAAATPRGQGSTVVFSNTASTGASMSQRVLDATINAAPTITVNPGARVSILVAKDIDFGSVYVNR